MESMAGGGVKGGSGILPAPLIFSQMEERLNTPATKADVQALEDKLDLIFYAQAEILTRLAQNAKRSMHFPLETEGGREIEIRKTMERLKQEFLPFSEG